MGAIDYAETKLEVHEILARTVEAREKLDEIYTILANNRDKKRALTHRIESREMDLAIAERGKHTDMSQAQMDKHLRMVIHQDEALIEARRELREVEDTLDGAEFDRRLEEKTIEIGCARMNELGGYLNYLAAVKSASVSTTRS